MSHVSDLVRTLRASPHRVDEKAAGALLARARAEGVRHADLQELANVLSSELGDNFSPQLRESLTSFVQGAQPGGRPVSDLLPDLERLGTPEEVAARLGADFVLLADQLIGDPKLTAKHRAERLLDFVLAYGERFVALRSGEAKPVVSKAPAEVLEQGLTAKGVLKPIPRLVPLPQPLPSSRTDAVKQFAHAMRQSGFEQLVDPRTGKDAIATTVKLLAAPTVAEFHRRSEHVRFEYLNPPPAVLHDRPVTSTAVRAQPARELGESAALKDRPRSEVERAGRLEPMRVQPWQAEAGRVVVQPVQGRDGKAQPVEEKSAHERWTDKVLGRNILWNVLHTYREGAEDEASKKDAMTQITIAALVLLVGFTLVAILLVAL